MDEMIKSMGRFNAKFYKMRIKEIKRDYLGKKVMFYKVTDKSLVSEFEIVLISADNDMEILNLLLYYNNVILLDDDVIEWLVESFCAQYYYHIAVVNDYDYLYLPESLRQKAKELFKKDKQVIYIKRANKLVSIREFTVFFKKYIISHLMLRSICMRITNMAADEKLFSMLCMIGDEDK